MGGGGGVWGKIGIEMGVSWECNRFAGFGFVGWGWGGGEIGGGVR